MFDKQKVMGESAKEMRENNSTFKYHIIKLLSYLSFLSPYILIFLDFDFPGED